MAALILRLLGIGLVIASFIAAPVIAQLDAELCTDQNCNAIIVNQGDTCGVGPNDGSKIGVFVEMCPCQQEGFYLTLTATGNDNQPSTFFDYQSLSGSRTVTAFTMPILALANNAVASGSLVKMQFQAGTQVYPQVNFTSSPVICQVYTGTTQTVTTTSVSTTTTTSSFPSTQTISILQATTTANCGTDTATVTAPPVTTTVTSTASERCTTLIIISTEVTYVTTHLPCAPDANPATVHLARAAASMKQLVERQATGGGIETPYCPELYGPCTTTTYYTSTSYSTSTTTATIVSQNIAIDPVTTTVTPSPATVTSCTSANTTITTTPTQWITTCSPLQPTSTTSFTYITLTQTVFPDWPPKKCPPNNVMDLGVGRYSPFIIQPDQLLRPANARTSTNRSEMA